MGEVIYPTCKYCGATHGMGIENMETGVIDPIDVCYNCLFPPVVFKPYETEEEYTEVIEHWRKHYLGIDLEKPPLNDGEGE